MSFGLSRFHLAKGTVSKGVAIRKLEIGVDQRGSCCLLLRGLESHLPIPAHTQLPGERTVLGSLWLNARLTVTFLRRRTKVGLYELGVTSQLPRECYNRLLTSFHAIGS